MTEHVVDSSVLLAILNEEPGGAQSLSLLPSALVSAVNHCEVVTKLTEWDESGARAEEIRSVLPYSIVDFDGDLAVRAGILRRATRSKGLSLGDRACLALALKEELPVYTADRRWKDLDLGVEVRFVR